MIYKDMSGNEFEYMISDDYDSSNKVPKGFVTKVIPKHTWAIFPCIGPSSKSIREVNKY